MGVASRMAGSCLLDLSFFMRGSVFFLLSVGLHNSRKPLPRRSLWIVWHIFRLCSAWVIDIFVFPKFNLPLLMRSSKECWHRSFLDLASLAETSEILRDIVPPGVLMCCWWFLECQSWIFRTKNDINHSWNIAKAFTDCPVLGLDSPKGMADTQKCVFDYK